MFSTRRFLDLTALPVHVAMIHPILDLPLDKTSFAANILGPALNEQSMEVVDLGQFRFIDRLEF